jgi:hypothetical protein
MINLEIYPLNLHETIKIITPLYSEIKINKNEKFYNFSLISVWVQMDGIFRARMGN